MKPHIYFDGEKWRSTVGFRPSKDRSLANWQAAAFFAMDMNEKRAMQYFTGR